MKSVRYQINNCLKKHIIIGNDNKGLRYKITESILDGPMADLYQPTDNAIRNNNFIQYCIGLILITDNSE